MPNPKAPVPEPVMNAKAALEALRAQNIPVSPFLEKALPSYALSLLRTGQPHTVETLMATAEQGDEYFKSLRESQNPDPEDFLSAYQRILGVSLKRSRQGSLSDVFEDVKATPSYAELIDACIMGNIDKVKAKLAANPLYPSDVLEEPYYLAKFHGHAEIREALQRRMFRDQYSENGSRNEEFIYASRRNHPIVIRILLEKGVSENAVANGFLRAAASGFTKVVALIAAKKEYIYQDLLDEAIHEALDDRHWQTMLCLANQGANLDKMPLELKIYVETDKKWKSKLNRTPPKGIRFNENPDFYKQSCMQDVATALTDFEGANEDQANVMAYNAAGLFQTSARVLQYLEKWKTPGKQPLHNLVQLIRLPQEGAPNLKDWGDAVLKCGPEMAKLLKFAHKMTSPMKSADGKTWSLVNTRNACSLYHYQNAHQHPQLASICVKHQLDEKTFDRALVIVKHKTPAEKNIPDITIEGTAFDAPGASFYRLPAGDVRGLILGEMTDCCQSIGGAGEECARHGYESINSGFYVVANPEGRIIGQSWAWRGKKNELCLDSLETLGECVNPDQWLKILRTFAAELTARQDHNLTALHVGMGGETPEMLSSNFARASRKAKPLDYQGYRDSDGQQIRVWKKLKALTADK